MPARAKTTLVILSALIGASLIVVCAVQFWDWYTTTRQLHVPSPNRTATHSSDKPNEAPIDTSKVSYSATAEQPQLLEIPALAVRGYIQQVGLDQYKAIATPENIHMAGWYTGSVKPGETGVSVIDGHVRGRFRPAIFRDLHQLKAGEVVTVTYGNGSRVSFAVTKTSTYPTQDAAAHIFKPLPPTYSELVLITCAGTYDKSNSMYNQRILVYAQRVDDR